MKCFSHMKNTKRIIGGELMEINILLFIYLLAYGAVSVIILFCVAVFVSVLLYKKDFVRCS